MHYTISDNVTDIFLENSILFRSKLKQPMSKCCPPSSSETMNINFRIQFWPFDFRDMHKNLLESPTKHKIIMRKINNDCTMHRIWSFICMSFEHSRPFSFQSRLLSFSFFSNRHKSQCRYIENVPTDLTRKMANFIVKPFEIDVNSMEMKNNTMHGMDWKWCSCQIHPNTAITTANKRKA